MAVCPAQRSSTSSRRGSGMMPGSPPPEVAIGVSRRTTDRNQNPIFEAQGRKGVSGQGTSCRLGSGTSSATGCCLNGKPEAGTRKVARSLQAGSEPVTISRQGFIDKTGFAVRVNIRRTVSAEQALFAPPPSAQPPNDANRLVAQQLAYG